MRLIQFACLPALLLFIALAVPVHAGGVVSICDEAHLVQALASGGTVTFDCSGTITLSATITVAIDTAIDGGGQDVTISGNHSVRVFTVQQGVTLSLNALTVANGSADVSESGGGIHNSGTLIVSNSTFSDNHAGSTGGGICNTDNGKVTLINTTLSGNGAAGMGGAIANLGGVVSLSGTTISDNTAAGYHKPTPNFGGGIANVSGAVNLSNSTIFGNRGKNGGGGIANLSGATVTVMNSTLSDNSGGADFRGGGILNLSMGTVLLGNSIVANSQDGGNCSGTITDDSGNLSYPDATCPGINSDPKLGPLQGNGGPTYTMALGPGSAAIDAGDDAVCATAPISNRDQRGLSRPQGSHCDIGAYEAATPIVITTPRAGTGPTLDGDITDWSGLGARAFLNTDTASFREGSQPNPSLSDLSGALWTAWAPEGLYFAGILNDDVVIGYDSDSSWGDDVIELSVYDVAGDRRTHQLTLCADGRQADHGVLISALTFVTRTAIGGWTFEAFVPAAFLGSSALTVDQIFPFTFGYWDDDLGGGHSGQTHLLWQGMSTYQDQADWGRMTLSGWVWNFPLQATQTPTPTATATATATRTWTPTATSTLTPTPSATGTPSPTVSSIPSETPTPTATTTPTTGSLSGRVWLDSNGNGSPDPGEPGIFGVNVRLYAAGGMLGTIVTEGDGLYRFPPLTPGVYRVVEVQPAWLPFSSTPNDVTIQVTHGGMAVVDFGDWAGLSAWLPLILR